mmetsp:Transcript_52590/g.94412  ORF Transcript_52590/g.94412 Transcript_52590/m.94412 type:complete len:171 (-) Transcript_52590:109-621(-)
MVPLKALADYATGDSLAVYKSYGGKVLSGEGPTCAVCYGDLADHQIVELHCGHAFCLEPCFTRLVENSHMKCPLCNTPTIVHSPDLDFISWRMFKITDADYNEEMSRRLDRLNQFRLIHDGEASELVKKLHGGVANDFLLEVRGCCRVCKFGSLLGAQNMRHSVPVRSRS